MKKIVVLLICFTTILVANPKLTSANAYRKAKDYTKAIELYNQVLQNNPRHEDALYGKGRTLIKKKQYDDALALFNTLVMINPKYKDALYRKAFVLRKLKRYSDATATYKQYTAVNPNDPDTYYGLAQTYGYQKKNAETAYYFQVYAQKEKRASEQKYVKRAVKRTEKLKKAFTPAEQKQFDKLSGKKVVKPVVKKITPVVVPVKTVTPVKKTAVKTITPVAIKKNTTSTSKTTNKDKTLNYMFTKGNQVDKLYLAGKYTEAIKQYELMLSKPKNRREALFKIAISYTLLKKYPEAVKYFSQIFLEEQDNQQTRQLLSILLSNPMVSRTFLTAENHSKQALGLQKVRAMIAQGSYFEAIALLDLLIAKIDQNNQAVLLKCDLLNILGDQKKQEETLATYLKKYPEDFLINERYGDHLKGIKKNDLAQKYYNKALSLTKDELVQKRIKHKLQK